MLTDKWRAQVRWRWVLGIALLVGVATCAVFHAAVGAEFLSWDDDINITGNPHVHGLTAENLRWMFTDTEYVRRYMPLGWLSWACQFQFFGDNPASYHLGNVLLHSLSAILLFLVLHRLLVVAAPGREQAAFVCAGVAALLWAIHPLRVEPVAWASGRLYCQAIFFLLFSLLAYLRYCDSRLAGRPSRAWFWGAVGAYALSLFTYPLALAFIGVLPILDVYPLRRFRFDREGWRSPGARQAILEKIPFAVVVALVFAVTLWARSGATGQWRPPPTLSEFNVPARIMQGFYVWAAYLGKTLAPHDLSPVYTTLVQFNPWDGPFVASVLVIVVITALVAWKRRQWPALVAGWICYLVLLVPMLGLTEHPHYANDRYSYLPGLALAAVGAAALLHFWNHAIARFCALGILGTATVVFGLMTVSQTRVWRDTDTLFLHIIAKTKDGPFRADTYCRLGNRRLAQARWEEAKVLFADSMRVAPRYVAGYSGLGEALSRQGRTEEAVSVFVMALKLRPPTAELLVRTAEALADLGRYDESIQHYRLALERNPGNGHVMNGLAWILATCPDEKMRDASQALLLAEKVADSTEHGIAEVEGTLAAAYAGSGRFQEAVQASERARSLAQLSGETNMLQRSTEILEHARRREPFRQQHR
ncbi:MAG: hypothetical protein QOF48_461 [Verrucomicrobiota bacterium]|jgi:tetratricopeptide (TPR) repeat protein